MIVGKYPRRLENLKMIEGCESLMICEARFSSSANVKPRSVTARAVNFR